MANINEIIQEINTNLPDNGTQQITAKKLRDTLIDTVYELQECYDISANTGKSYVSLSEALGSAGGNVPVDIRKGGMRVRFNNSTTKKYEEWRYVLYSTSNSVFANVNNWRGVDDQVSATSNNIVTSKGIYNSMTQYGWEYVAEYLGQGVQNDANMINFDLTNSQVILPAVMYVFNKVTGKSIAIRQQTITFDNSGYRTFYFGTTTTGQLFMEQYRNYVASDTKIILGVLSIRANNEVVYDTLKFDHKINGAKQGIKIDNALKFGEATISYAARPATASTVLKIDTTNKSVITPNITYTYDIYGNYLVIPAQTVTFETPRNGLYLLFFNTSTNDLSLECFSQVVPDNNKILLGNISFALNSSGNITSIIDHNFKFAHVINDDYYPYMISLNDLPEEVTSVPNLQGKKLSILGDSISTYSGYIPSGNASFYPRTGCDVDDVKYTWWKQLVDNTGMTLIINESWSGSRIATPPEGHTAKPFTDPDRYNNLGDPDIIIVNGGLNDTFAQTSPTAPGEFNLTMNTANLSKTVFKQAYQFLIATLLTTYPNAKIFICIPTFINHNLFSPNDQGVTWTDFHNIIKQLADYYGVGLIDLSNCGITVQNGSVTRFDGAHPNRVGQHMIYEKVLGTLREYFV